MDTSFIVSMIFLSLSINFCVIIWTIAIMKNRQRKQKEEEEMKDKVKELDRRIYKLEIK